MSPREEISAASLPRFRQRVGRATRWVVGMALSLSLLPLLGEAWADVLVVRGQAKPMVGTVVAEQEDRVTIAIKDAEGITREQIVPRDQILLIARAEDPARLDALQAGQWEGYRELAEELASQRVDPQAVQLAIRLFLIVAYHERGSAREGSLASLVSLARSPDEERRFRTLAYRYGENDRVQWLKPPATAIRAPLSALDREMLLRTVRLVRQDEGEQALLLMRQEGFTTMYLTVEHLLPFQDLKRYAYDHSLSPRRTADLVRFELALLAPDFAPGDSTEVVRGTTGWSSIGLETLPPLHDVDWLNASEFDPRDHVYENGSWRRP